MPTRSFSEVAVHYSIAPAPIGRELAGTNIPVKCGPRPVPRLLAQAVFDRVVMYVIHMPREIGFVADLVFPEAPLPDRGFPVFVL